MTWTKPEHWVPHWCVFASSLIVASLVAGLMIVGGGATMLAEADVRCTVATAYVRDGIKVPFNCHGVAVQVGNAELVIDILTQHATMVTCRKLYASGRVEGCTITHSM